MHNFYIFYYLHWCLMRHITENHVVLTECVFVFLNAIIFIPKSYQLYIYKYKYKYIYIYMN